MTSAVATSTPRSTHDVAASPAARRAIVLAAAAAAGVAIAALLPSVALAGLILATPVALVALLSETSGPAVADDPKLLLSVLGLPSAIR
ncbi:MAG TPA: hypothetical protein VFK54_13395 [Candidatus Limnocylindrales bacterium]|nr:hypothetical protein [Candidatus Limnocylindrales bacterium]